MLSRLILDKLIPLPTEDEEMAALQSDLDQEGYPVTNLKSGGVFYMLARILIRLEVELTKLHRKTLSDYFVTSSDDVNWLSLRASDFQEFRKQAVKTQGVLTLTREVTASTVKIKRGCIFKTAPDSTGEELRFLSTEEVVFAAGSSNCTVPIEAEIAGAAYNVPVGKISRCLIHLESVTGITNGENWMTREGADIESLEGLRSRLTSIWSRLSTQPTRDKYKSVCEAVPGVLGVTVNDQHPRGQGTVDIIVTSATGTASEALLADVRAAAETIAGPYDNLLIKASTIQEQDIAVTVLLPSTFSDEGVAKTVEETLERMVTISKGRELNALYLSDLIVAIRAELPTAKDVRITTPAGNVVLASDVVITLGTVTTTIERA